MSVALRVRVGRHKAEIGIHLNKELALRMPAIVLSHDLLSGLSGTGHNQPHEDASLSGL